MSDTKKSPLHHWMKLNGWGATEMAKHLGCDRVTVHRFENYKRKPGDELLTKIAALPNFPLTKDQLKSDYESNYQRPLLRRAS